MAEKKKELNIEEAFARLEEINKLLENPDTCLLYTSPSPRD